mmetsp:Transcript_23737/g.65952  ORF Transcript_23737/g.65952 Transcript_23737/m.65952 type:complete len:693 (-) Transcript_23737:67-2145(-)
MAILFVKTGSLAFIFLFQVLLYSPSAKTTAAARLLGSPTKQNYTSSVCRQSPVFRYRIDLFYNYQVEFTRESTLDLKGLEKSIAKSLVTGVGICSASTFSGVGHKISTKGNCSGACQVVKGVTSVLTENDPMGVLDVMFDVLELVLDNETLLNQYSSSPIINCTMVASLGQYISRIPKQSEREGTKPDVAPLIGIVVVALFLCAAIGCIFLHGMNRGRSGSTSKFRLSYYLAMRRKFWDQMEGGNQSPGLVLTPEAPGRGQSTAWSVSDLSSEERSIKSALRLDRIEEESEAESDAEAEETEVGTEVKQISYIPDWRKEGNDRRLTNPDTSVWDRACHVGSSYFDDSDPEASTPAKHSADSSGSAEAPGPVPCLLNSSSDDDGSSHSSKLFQPAHTLNESHDKSHEAPSDERFGSAVARVSGSSHLLSPDPRSDGSISNDNRSKFQFIMGSSYVKGSIPTHIQCLADTETISDESFDASASERVSSSSEESRSYSSFSDDLSGRTSPSYVALTPSFTAKVLAGNMPQPEDDLVRLQTRMSHLSTYSTDSYVKSPSLGDNAQFPEESLLGPSESDVETASGSVETMSTLLMHLGEIEDTELPSSVQDFSNSDINDVEENEGLASASTSTEKGDEEEPSSLGTKLGDDDKENPKSDEVLVGKDDDKDPSPTLQPYAKNVLGDSSNLQHNTNLSI